MLAFSVSDTAFHGADIFNFNEIQVNRINYIHQFKVKNTEFFLKLGAIWFLKIRLAGQGSTEDFHGEITLKTDKRNHKKKRISFCKRNEPN